MGGGGGGGGGDGGSTVSLLRAPLPKSFATTQLNFSSQGVMLLVVGGHRGDRVIST